ncbi:hypothetical protein DHW03_04680 [Pedobacter yonginense]|uniref:DUF3857 domain-containing protein n=1 Tax=Pedobacter yonginense TaxID=651869 RepID=A0A317ER14_9SPHI|nr:DUF3857 domain-containing transglutaminase family protein [Pedobacter yonginense]PWS29124.1 hypothetical protein DHW03_04680 [Pedobacter yonginense]
MRSIITFILLCFLSNPVFCQDNYDVDLIPSNLRNRANSCIRNEERVVDMQSPDNVMLNVKKAITVFNENGEEDARLVLHYDKNVSIKSIKGEIYNASGMLISKFNQNNFADVSAADGFSLFVDSRIKHYLPSINQFPYTIVYNFEIRSKQNLIIPDWVPKPGNDVSIEKSRYTFICRPTDVVRIKAQNFSGEPEESRTEKQITRIWKVSNVVAVKTEPYSPDAESYETSVKIAPQQFTYFGKRGSYSNWQDLGKWIYDDLLKGRNELAPSTIEYIKNLVKDEKTDQDKARKIYQYLQDKTRYISVQIGIGGFQPVPASEVDRLGYGDCKALVNYMQSLLRAVNIDSYYCVVEAGSTKKSFDASYASMVQGNHIILCMPLKGDTTWLECTSQKIPFGFLSDFTDDRLVLACTAEGGKLLHTPKLTTENNLQIRKADLILKADGNVTGKVNTVFSGAQYDNQEHIIGKPVAEQHKLLKDYYDIDNIDFQSVIYSQKKDIHPEVTENIDINIKNYAPVNAQKMFLQLNAFNIKKSIPEVRNRTLPVYLNRGFTDEDEITYTLPDNVQMEFIKPERKNLKSPFGEYISKTTIDGKKLTYYRKFVLNDGTFPATSYEAFSKFIADVNSADYLKLALSLK